jgi:hypothetical protein
MKYHNRIVVLFASFVMMLEVFNDAAPSAFAFQPATEVTPIPAGTAESVVLVATEFDGQTVFAATGFVFSRNGSRAYIAVDSDPNVKLNAGVQAKLVYRAVVRQGAGARSVDLQKLAVLEAGQRTIYGGPADELPQPLPAKATAVARERSPLLLIGVESRRGQVGNEYSLVAVQGEVEGLYRNPNTLVTSYGFRPVRPLTIRRGLLVTPEGALVGTAVIDPEQPRTTSGYLRYLSRPWSELANIGAPEVGDARANIVAFDGKARVDVVLRPIDPLSRMTRPRLLVRTSFAPGKQRDGMSGEYNVLLAVPSDSAPITIKDGRWIDKPADGQEIDLAELAAVDPTFDMWVNKEKLPVGKVWGGSVEFPVPGDLPFSWLFVDVGVDGALTPLARSGCVMLKDNLELFGNYLGPSMWGRPATTQANTPTMPTHPDGGMILTSNVARKDIPLKPVDFVPEGTPEKIAESLIWEVRDGKGFSSSQLSLKVTREDDFQGASVARRPMALTADGKTLLVVDTANVLHKVDVDTWTDVMRLPLGGKCEELIVSGAGAILPLKEKNAALVVDVETLAVKHVLPIHDQQAVAAGNKSPLVFVIELRRWVVFDAATGKAVQVLPRPMLQMAAYSGASIRPLSVSMTPDGRYLSVVGDRVARFRMEGLQVVLEESSPVNGHENALRINFIPNADPTNDRGPQEEFRLATPAGDKITENPILLDNNGVGRPVAISAEAGRVFTSGPTAAVMIFDLEGKLGPYDALRDKQEPHHILIVPPGDRALYWGSRLTVVDTNRERLKAARK